MILPTKHLMSFICLKGPRSGRRRLSPRPDNVIIVRMPAPYPSSYGHPPFASQLPTPQNARMKSQTARKMGGAIAPPAPPSRTPMSINFADSDFSLSFMSFVDVDVIIAHLYRMFPNRRGRSKLQGSGGPEPRVE